MAPVSKTVVEKICFLLLGLLIGASGTTVLTGQHIDRLTVINQQQAEQLRDLERELAQVKDSLSQRQAAVVSSLEVNIIFTAPKPSRPEEDAIRLSLEKQVKELLTPLMGKKLEQLEGTLIPWILENRVLEAEGHRFKIKVRLVVLAEKVHVEVEAAEMTVPI
ncbi:MAG TPA: hypothetical protein GX504_02685 [Clostridia bacterium]|nr:hypothetical protein [Clostridia bacterium]